MASQEGDHRRPSPAGVVARRGLWRSWVVANAAGEAVGLGSAAVIGYLAQEWLEGSVGVLLAAALSALAFGLFEGAVLGTAQHLVLARPLPFLRRSEWVIATVTGGVVAWLGASLAMAAMRARSAGPEPAALLQAAMGVPVGITGGVVLGVPQWLALRSSVSRSLRWVGANGLAWGVGMPVVFLAAGLVPAGTPAAVVAIVAVAALTAAGALVGAVHGWFLVRMVGSHLDPNPYPHHVVEVLERQVERSLEL
jgi:hypothetical protein